MKWEKGKNWNRTRGRIGHVESLEVVKLEPRSHGGLRLSGDLPGRSRTDGRFTGFIYLPREEDVSSWRVEA